MASEVQNIVETRDLVKIYGDGEEVHALDGVTMNVRAGEMIAVIGPSGSGKSTLLNILGALDRPTRGEVIINGQSLAAVKRLDRFRNQTVGFIFQLHNLIPTLTAVENVEIPLYEQRLSGRERRNRALELLELVDMSDRVKHLPGQLSGGQRQRVAVARALVNRPALVLADEPTGSLDSARADEIIHMMHDLNRRLGTTFIIVTHDPKVARQTDRIVVLDSGRIVRIDIITDPYSEDLRVFQQSPLGQAILEQKQPDLEVDGVAIFRAGAPTEVGRILQQLLQAESDRGD